MFAVKPDERGEQEFCVLPDFVVGSYIKFNLLGKVSRQTFEGSESDNLLYTAIKYSGVAGRSLSEYTD